MAAGLVTSLAPMTKATSACGELAVDVLELEHLVVGHVGFRQQHVHVAGHAARHRVDGVLHLDALGLQLVRHLAQGVLRLRHRHAVARHDDDLRGVLHDEGGVVGRALLHRPGLDRAAAGGRGLAAEAAEDHRDEAAVHALAHDVGQDRARGADQRAGDDEREVAQREADARRRPARIGVEHRHHHRHVGAADGDDQRHAEHEGDQHDQPEGRVALGADEDDEQHAPAAGRGRY